MTCIGCFPGPEVRDGTFRATVLQALQAKSAGRSLGVNRQSIADPEVRRRSEKDYAHLQAEIVSELPDFEQAYAAVQKVLRSSAVSRLAAGIGFESPEAQAAIGMHTG